MPERDSIRVTIVDESRNQRVQARISTFLNVKTIVLVLVRKLGFPLVAFNDRPLLYSLWHIEGDRALTTYENLAAARVRDGDTLEITSIFAALVDRSAKHFDVSDAPVMVGDEAICIVSEDPPEPSIEKWVPLGLTVNVSVRKRCETRVIRKKDGKLVVQNL
jgi:hypothetical protein